jgi:hypothetical protein
MGRRANPRGSYQADLSTQAPVGKRSASVSFAQPFRGNGRHDGSMAFEIRPAEIVTSPHATGIHRSIVPAGQREAELVTVILILTAKTPSAS